MTLDIATYNWPWLKTSYGKNKPTLFKNWLWLLFIVIANDTWLFLSTVLYNHSTASVPRNSVSQKSSLLTGSDQGRYSLLA